MPFKIGDHTRPEPPEWPDLMYRSSEIVATLHDLPPEEPIPLPQSRALYGLTEGLSGLALERNRYFGLGQAMCQMTILLSDPTIREQTIDSVADEMAEVFGHWGDISAAALPISSIGGLANYPFFEVSRQAAKKMPLAEELLTTALGERTFARRRNIAVMPDGFRLANIQDRNRLTDALRKNTQAAPGSVLRRAILAHSFGTATPASLVKDVITEEELRGLQLEKVAQALASSRIDEFRDWQKGLEPICNIVKPGPDGKFIVDKRYLRDHPPGPVLADPENGSLPTLRTERLVCPAMQAGLILPILGMMPEITIRADQLIHNRYYRESDI